VRLLRPLIGPETVFLGGSLLAVAGWSASQALLPAAAMSVACAILLVLGGLLAGIFWRDRSIRCAHITYFDAGGAMFLLGCCAAVLTEPDALIRLLSPTEQD
jgi:hypothetical protein